MVHAFLNLIAAYAALGLVFGLIFVTRGAGRIDPNATEGTIGFRILILPGVIALWPMLLLRWVRGRPAPPSECNAHRRLAERLAAQKDAS